MKAQSFSYPETIKTVQAFNQFVDELDTFIIKTQQQYNESNSRIQKNAADHMARFESDCEAQIAAVRAKSHSVITEAKAIQAEMNALDRQLSSIDKYYVKTKRKKAEEFAGKQSCRYAGNGDYFAALSQIKKDYAEISYKYKTDILPGLINGLNYIFSSKRKRDYEELIILFNTVDAFVVEISEAMPELTAETINDMRRSHETQRSVLIHAQEDELKDLETQYAIALENLATAMDQGTDRILPRSTVEAIAQLLLKYEDSLHAINGTKTVKNDMLFISLIGYPVSTFIQTKTLSSFIREKYKQILIGEKLVFPIVCATHTPLSLLIRKGQGGEALNRLTNGIIHAFMMNAPVGSLQINVIDVENQGNSVAAFYDVKKKMPEIFRDKIITGAENAAERIRELNETIAEISQNILGTQYDSVFEYAAEHPDYQCTVNLLTIFDFPKGIGEHSLGQLNNIISHGPKCGIYTVITERPDTSDDYHSSSYTESLKSLRAECTIITQQEQGLSIAGLPYLFMGMPKKEEFDSLFSNYMLYHESMKHQGIVFPDILRKLIDSRTDDELDQSIANICSLVDRYDAMYARCPDAAVAYPEQVVLGMAYYPADIFHGKFGTQKIVERFGTSSGRIALPLTLDFRQSANIMLSYSESKNGSAAPIINHIAWSMLSSVPVTGLDVIVCDPDKKGGSIVPFLDFRKKSPDTFDDELYTSAEKICERLQKLNNRIDDLIQNKFGYTYQNIYDYNLHTPTRVEKICLLVVCDFPECFDSRAVDLLQNILKNGGKCGIYTVICHNRDVRYSSYDNIEDRIEILKRYCSCIEMYDRKYQLMPFGLSVIIKEAPTAAQVETFVRTYVATVEKIKNKALSFADILDPELYARAQSSALSIPIGIGDGEKVISIVFGKGSSHHALIAGATGSGKSTLLHTMIVSSMLHYTPEQLNLYLMDFKSGTEFKVYETKRLPHIKLLALDAMQEFGESILMDLVDVLARRSEEFKRVGASKLGEYLKLSQKPMPKILIIMDEFQILFNDASNRKVAYHCAELAKRIVTEGRSYGMHLVMATQSTKIISNLTIESGTVEQMRIRIGMKCGAWDATYLFTDRNEEKALEMMKGPIGTAVLNQEYTESDNVGLRVAYCDDKAMDGYLTMISDRFADRPYALQTFEGARTIELLETESGRKGGNSDETVSIEVGTLIKVAPPLNVVFDRRRKHNTLICGTSERMNENLSNLYLFGMVKNRRATVYCFDGERLLGPSNADRIYAAFSRMSSQFIVAESRGDIVRYVNSIYDTYANRKKRGGGESIFIVIKNLQYLDIVRSMFRGDMIDESEYIEPAEPADSFDAFDFGTSAPALGVSEKMLKIIDDGSAYGIHLIVASMEYQCIKDCMYFGENILAKFPERYIFSLNDGDAESLIESVSVASLRDNTVYYSDSVKNTFQMKPYVFPKPNELEAYLNTFER